MEDFMGGGPMQGPAEEDPAMQEEQLRMETPPAGLPDPNSPLAGGMTAPGGPDPSEDIPDEVVEAYAEDLIARGLAFISDSRNNGQGTPADAVMQRLNIRGMEAPKAIGGTAAEIVLMITNNAKRQGVEYPGMSIMLGGLEIVEALMDISKSGGVFPDMPEDENDPARQDVALQSALEATKAYGERLLATGQVKQEEYAQILQEAMEEEAAAGELDDWDPNSMMTPEAMSGLMERGASGQGGQKDTHALEGQPQFMQDEGLM